MSDFVKADKETIEAIYHLVLAEEFTVSNAMGDTISGGYTDWAVSLNDGTNLRFKTVDEAVNKLVERSQQFC